VLKKDKQPAVFLDRDGTINVEKEYLYKEEDFEFIPGVPEAIRALKNAGYLVVVVTNQSGVGRGYYDSDAVNILHRHIQKQLSGFDTAVDAFYICPHHPEHGVGQFLQDCDCRKGKPGMLLQAAQDYDIDLTRSYMIGDKIEDVEAGQNAGSTPILVLTGYGQRDLQKLATNSVKVCADLAEAVQEILKNDL
jgi:D-glycero-D-manno-heptose 1,7-bisphosphate phosphatase